LMFNKLLYFLQKKVEKKKQEIKVIWLLVFREI